MKKNVVIITARGRDIFKEEQAARLEEFANVTYHSSLEPIPEEVLIPLLKDAEIAGLTPRSVPVIGSSWISCLPNLRGIAVFATGVDYIDVEVLHKQGIQLSHLPDYSTISVAEHTIGLLLTLSRRIHLSQDRVRGRVPQTTSVQGWELRGKTIGIIGLGRIGSYVAKLASAFGMRVLGYDPRQMNMEGVIPVSMNELIASSDIITLHRPSSWETTAQFGAEEIMGMKRGSWLINASRCALVDPEAVVMAIDTGQLRGYAVDDIFPLQDRAAQYIGEGRIVQTGHTAWYSAEVIERGYDSWVDNIQGLIVNRPMNLITPASSMAAI